MNRFALLVLLALSLIVSTSALAQKPEEETFKRAIADAQAGNIANAIAALTAHIKKHPKQVDAYFFRGKLKLTSGDSTGALADFNRVILLKPDMGQAYHERAYIRVIAKDIDGAIKDLDTAINYNYKGDHVYSLRGQLKLDKGDLKGALTDFDESLKLNPGNPQIYASRAGVLLTLEDRDRALVDLNYLLSWYETEPWTSRAIAETNDRPYQGELNAFSETRPPTLLPGDKGMVSVMSNAYANRGLIHAFQENSDAAISDYTKSIRLDPKNMWPYYYRAKELEGKADLAAALADVSRAIQLDPRNGNFRVEHGVILTLMGNPKDAQIDFDMLLTSDRELWQKRINERMEAVKKKLSSVKN